MNNISRIGLVASTFYIVGFGWRYFAMWYDPSQAIVNVGLGAAFFGVFYLYHLYKEEKEKNEKRFKHNEAVIDEVELIIKREIEGKR